MGIEDAAKNERVRVTEGGEVLDRIQLDRTCFATMLGSPGRRTLFIMVRAPALLMTIEYLDRRSAIAKP